LACSNEIKSSFFIHIGTKNQDPSLWYGIGLLYDRYGCLEQAEGAFKGVLKMDPNFEKKEDIYFQLGFIHKQQLKLREALEVCLPSCNLHFYLCIKTPHER
jgi:tetratricopeptide (TPR) repeat protein